MMILYKNNLALIQSSFTLRKIFLFSLYVFVFWRLYLTNIIIVILNKYVIVIHIVINKC